MTYRTAWLCTTVALGSVLVKFHDWSHVHIISLGLLCGLIVSRIR